MKGGGGWGFENINPPWWGVGSMDLFQTNTIKGGQ